MMYTMTQIDDQKIGTLLNGMKWRTLDVKAVGRPLFTSDRPVIMSNGVAHPGSHLLLPISPTRLFLATHHNADTERHFAEVIPRRELVKACNRHVIRRAQKYAWNVDDSELDFVRKHLSAEAYMDKLFWESAPNRALEERRQQKKRASSA
jgi:hypothetical protein